jgi:hypothetical protein
LRPIERFQGTGTVTTRRGKEISVQYHLCFSPPENGKLSAAALKDFSGQVWCPYDGSFVCVHEGQIMTLRMEDGRKLRFVHSNRDGAVTVTQWLG